MAGLESLGCAGMDSRALARAIRAGELDPVELAAATCASLAATDASFHHLASERFDAALQEARDVDMSAPFAGVPILLKDHLAAMAGERLWSGSAYLSTRDHRASADAPITTAIRRAGFVVCGRSTCSELAATPTSEPAAFPAVRNPWAPERVAGGSSGGSAAAVSCGAIPVAHGNDTGGSIRIPAAACGVVGFKPSRGRMPLDPLVGAVEPALNLTTDFFLTRSVGDAIALFTLFAGDRDPTRTVRLAGSGPGPSPRTLRVGIHSSASNVGSVTDPACTRAAEHALGVLEHLGHVVVDDKPTALEDPILAAVTLPVVARAMAGTLDRLAAQVGTPPKDHELEPYTRAMVDLGRKTSFVEYLGLVDRLRDYSARVLRGWGEGGIDVLVTPTLAELPPSVGTYTSAEDPLWPMIRSAPSVCFTAPFNVTGQPAISLPLWHDGGTGLPIGVQLIAAPGRDELLLELAAQLEQLGPVGIDPGRRPRLSPLESVGPTGATTPSAPP